MIDEQDLIAYLTSKGSQVYRAPGNEVTVHCIFCADGDPKGKGKLYLNTESWLYDCKRCGAVGNRKTLLEHFGDEDALQHTAGTDPMMRRRLLTEAADLAHEMLLGNEKKLQYLLDRGISGELIISQKLGYVPKNVGLSDMLPSRPSLKGYTDLIASGLVTVSGKEFFNDAITIPYFSHGSVIQMRAKFIDGKYLTAGGDNVRLYNADALHGADRILVTEGEFDSLAVRSQIEQANDRWFEGLAVVGLAGASSWPEGFVESLAGASKVFIGLDPDDMGAKFAKKLKEQVGNKARLVELPRGEPKTDWTDFFLDKTAKNPHGGHDWRDLQEMLIESDLAGKQLFNIADIHSKWRRNKTEAPGLKLGWPCLDSVIRPGLRPGQIMIPLAKSGTGKGHPLGTRVPTPSGMRLWGDLKVGDLVFGSDGRPTEVTGVFDRGVLPTYRVRFSDGTSVEADWDHIWSVRYRYGAQRKWIGRMDIQTSELADADLRTGSHQQEWRYTIPMTEPVAYDGGPLPIPAYLMGALIANGTLGGTSVVLTTPDEDVIERVRAEWPDLRRLQRQQETCPAYIIRKTIGPVRDLGLNVRSAEKFIPEIYLTASIEDRMALLQGLMDGDGSSRANLGRRSCRYSTTSGRLAHDMVRLVTSLGGTATWNKAERTQPSGRLYDAYEMSIMLDTVPFGSGRKGAEPVVRNQRVPRRAIVGVDLVDPQEIRCISVAAADQLYLIGDEHIVTHNTVFLSNIAHNLRANRVLYVSLEMTAAEVFEHMRRIHRFWFPNADHAQLVEDYRFLHVVERNRVGKGDLTDFVREYTEVVGLSPELLIIDYLQYYSRAFRGSTPYERASDAVMELKAVGKEEQVSIICPSQVNRGAEHGKPISADDARDSGVVEETGDFLISLFRPDQVMDKQGDGSLLPQTGDFRGQILKSRHGGKGRLLHLQMSLLSLAIVDASPLGDPRVRARIDQENSLYRQGVHYEDFRRQIEHEASSVPLFGRERA